MPNASIQRVLREVENCVFESAVLYANEVTRDHIRDNLTDRLCRCMLEDWQYMFSDHKQSIESMQKMLVTCEKLQDSGEFFVPNGEE